MSFFKKTSNNMVRLVNMVVLKKIHSQRFYFEYASSFEHPK